MKLRRFSPVLLAGALCLLLSGCFVKTVDELYTLPRHSDEYDNLQMAIDEVMAADGCSYSAPVSGSNQQSVQLADLDGDGEESHSRLTSLTKRTARIRTLRSSRETARRLRAWNMWTSTARQGRRF